MYFFPLKIMDLQGKIGRDTLEHNTSTHSKLLDLILVLFLASRFGLKTKNVVFFVFLLYLPPATLENPTDSQQFYFVEATPFLLWGNMFHLAKKLQ